MSQAYSYVRFSDPSQSLGSSAERQTEKAVDYCQRMKLDLSPVSFKDLGLSGYHGKHLAAKGALAAFIEAVESGKIPSGSHLVIENIDRASRLEPFDGLELIVKKLLKLGITLHTIQDGMIYQPEDEKKLEKLIVLIMQLARSHSESAFKAERVTASFHKRWKDARENGKPIGGKCPGWIEVVNGQYKIIPEAKKIILMLCDMALEGNGPNTIARYCNQSNIPTLSKRNMKNANRYDISLVNHYLKTKTLLGIHQPTIAKDGKRVPAGEPIHLYPPVISEELYYKVQATFLKRSIGPAKAGKNVGNVFGQLLSNYPDESAIRFSQHTSGKRLLRSANAMLGVSKGSSFPYEVFEEELIQYSFDDMAKSHLLKAKSKETLNPSESAKVELEIIQAKISEAEAIIDSGEGSFSRLAKRIAKLEEQEKALIEQLKIMPHTMAIDTVAGLDQLAEVYKVGDYASRSKVKAILGSIFRKISVKIDPISRLNRRIYCFCELLNGNTWLLRLEKNRGKEAVIHAIYDREWTIKDLDKAESLFNKSEDFYWKQGAKRIVLTEADKEIE